MAHFARVENGVVTQVIVAEDSSITTSLGGTWVQTSYNTRGGVHYGQDQQPDGGIALRKNFAGIGFIYDSVLDAFYPNVVDPAFELDPVTCGWVLRAGFSMDVSAQIRSSVLDLPVGVPQSSISVEGTQINDGDLVLFSDLTTGAWVYLFAASSGSFIKYGFLTLNPMVKVLSSPVTNHVFVNEQWQAA